MTTISVSTLQVVYLVCLAILFLLFLTVMIFFLRLVVKWTKVADLLNKKLEGGWRIFDFNKLVALKDVVAGALPYLTSWMSKVTDKKQKTKTKK